MEDSKIIELYFGRDEQALAETAHSYGERLNSLSLGILKNAEDAKEAVNDTYLNAWNAIPPQRPVRLYAFLAQICRRLCFGMLDRQQAQKRNGELVALSDELANCIPDRFAAVELRDEAIGKLLTAFLQTLPAEARRIFLRRYWFCDSIAVIAGRYHRTESSVKTLLTARGKNAGSIWKRREFHYEGNRFAPGDEPCR